MRSEPSVVDITRGRWCTAPLPGSAAPRRGRRWDGRAMERNTVSLVSAIGVLFVKKECSSTRILAVRPVFVCFLRLAGSPCLPERTAFRRRAVEQLSRRGTD